MVTTAPGTRGGCANPAGYIALGTCSSTGACVAPGLGWMSVADGCCVGCTDLNFLLCTTPCKIVVNNGDGRMPRTPNEVVGSTSQFAIGTGSLFETRSADDFVLAAACDSYHICYVEGCILTNCPTFDGVFEIYNNVCRKPSFALHGTPLAGPFTATKIIPLNYQAMLDGKMVNAYKLEFHDLTLVLPGGTQYWISIGVRYSFSLSERAYFCYNSDCGRNCLIRWNDGHVLTATSIDADSEAIGGNALGWAHVGNDFAFLIAADGLNSPGPVLNSSPSCGADFNRDGSINVEDVFDYMSAWFVGCP
jgi:hypothetical protein